MRWWRSPFHRGTCRTPLPGGYLSTKVLEIKDLGWRKYRKVWAELDGNCFSMDAVVPSIRSRSTDLRHVSAEWSEDCFRAFAALLNNLPTLM